MTTRHKSHDVWVTPTQTRNVDLCSFVHAGMDRNRRSSHSCKTSGQGTKLYQVRLTMFTHHVFPSWDSFSTWPRHLVRKEKERLQGILQFERMVCHISTSPSNSTFIGIDLEAKLGTHCRIATGKRGEEKGKRGCCQLRALKSSAGREYISMNTLPEWSTSMRGGRGGNHCWQVWHLCIAGLGSHTVWFHFGEHPFAFNAA